MPKLPPNAAPLPDHKRQNFVRSTASAGMHQAKRLDLVRLNLPFDEILFRYGRTEMGGGGIAGARAAKSPNCPSCECCVIGLE